MIWSPDTCYCVISTRAPSKKGDFLKRCRIHASSRNTIDVYDHNKLNRLRSNEIILSPNRKNNKEDHRRINILRESTRP